MENTSYLINGPISPALIASEIAAFNTFTNVGAQTLFIGQVRNDTIDGKAVSAIEYSAYHDMANKAFAQICVQAAAQFSDAKICIKHSVGTVAVGEMCLLVVTATPHRNMAYEVSRFVVEAIKKHVPVYGKELFADNTYTWKENKF